MKTDRIVDALERMHQRDVESNLAWLGQLARDAHAVLEPDAGLLCALMRGPELLFLDVPGLAPELMAQMHSFAQQDMPPRMEEQAQFAQTFCRSRFVERWSQMDYSNKEQHSAPYMQWMNAADGVFVSLEPSFGLGLILIAAQRVSQPLVGAARDVTVRLALHVETAVRARLNPSAVLGTVDPRGVIELGERVPERAVRTQLVQDLRRIELLRTLAHRRDGERALELWRALTSGSLSLREFVDHDGKRLYEICENPPQRRAIRALGGGQLDVVRYASRGMGNKQIAYALGYSQSYVSKLLAEAAVKLGLQNARALVRLASRLLPGCAPPVSALTPAEQAVLDLLADGLSNREIARERGVAERTIANQVASVLTKTGSSNRRALLVRGS